MYNLSPLHIGTGRENYDSSASELHSDTLSSALAAVGVETGMSGNVEDFLTSFSMSSAFPFYRDIFFSSQTTGTIECRCRRRRRERVQKKA